MAKIIRTEIIIHASPEKVWSVLSDFNSYPGWNPFIRSLEGEVKTGNRIRVKIVPPGTSGMVFKPRVLSFIPNKEFKWLGHLLFKGLFDGEHHFQLTDNGNGTTTFVHSEVFRGVLVPLFMKQLDGHTRRGFEEMNSSLKEQAERK